MPKEEVDCDACEGTGIGMFGDPNTSRCTECKGKGTKIIYEDEKDEDD